jgi:cytochrome P450
VEPSNPIAAVGHGDPYPYYASLAPFALDHALGLWVASRIEVIEEVLANPHCLVRPAGQAVPEAIAGSAAGSVYARLMRMNEGPAHHLARQVVGRALADVDLQLAARYSAVHAGALHLAHGLTDGARLTRWMFDLPTYVVAHLLGFGATELPVIAAWTAQFVRCLSPLATPEQLTAASRAAHALRGALADRPAAGLAAEIWREAARAGWSEQDAIVANLVGLLSQTHEASAGLIGNCIVTLLRDPSLRQDMSGDPEKAASLVRLVASTDPPVQNTRRFVAQPTCVAGVALQGGDAILLLLGARGRAGPALLTFGHGRHACPGQALALAIATAAVQYLVGLPLPWDRLDWHYAASTNGRLPRFCERDCQPFVTER